MTTLQNDLLEIYNSLVMFSNSTVNTKFPLPIKVWYEKESRLLVFEQKGKSARLGLPIYYSLGLDSINNYTYLLPKDYDYLMSTLQGLIGSGELIKPRVCLSPENYGFDIYIADSNPNELWKGPGTIGVVRFVSGNSWFFKKLVEFRFRGKL